MDRGTRWAIQEPTRVPEGRGLVSGVHCQQASCRSAAEGCSIVVVKIVLAIVIVGGAIAAGVWAEWSARRHGNPSNACFGCGNPPGECLCP